MTVLEFWGCALIAFGPALAMFSLTVANNPIRVILLILSSFFWLLSFLLVAICWAVINSFCDYLIIGAYLAVLSQEVFRYLFHKATKKAQTYMVKLMNPEASEGLSTASRNSSRTEEIQLKSSLIEFPERIPLSYGKCLSIDLLRFITNSS